jgi:hypothetical protein
MKIKGLIRLVASVAALFTLSGCFQSETTVHVKADGSGTVVEETMLGAQASAMLGGMGGMMPAPDGKPAKNPLDEMFSEEKAKKKASEMGEGVTFVKLENLDKDGKKGARITYAFEDINKLKLGLDSGSDTMEGMGDGMPGNEADKGKKAEKKGDPVRFKFKNGKLTILMPKPDEEAKLEKPEGAPDATDLTDEMNKDPQAEAMAKAMFADMKMSVRVVVESGIKKTDATHVDGNTITLMEMNFGEIMQNEKGMKVLDQLEGKNPEEIAELLKGVEGVKIETKEKIKVQMK